MDQNDAALYLEKYEQCLSRLEKKQYLCIYQIYRALTAMKTSVLASLEQCKEDILYKNVKTDRLSAMGSPGDQQNVILSYVDDDTFTLLYGVFGMKANSIR
jgi:hypothetical protein